MPMDVTIGRAQASEGPTPETPLGEGATPSGDATRGWGELSERGLAAVLEARRWVVANPFAALGIALATGFVTGRVVRTWLSRA